MLPPIRTPHAGDVTRTLEEILRAAVTEGASDVHFEPKEDGLLVRFRLDGEMREHLRLPVAQRDPLLARGKIFGGMDITEKRLPQDGRAVLREKARRFHLRLSTLPTVHGESLVVRLLDQTMPGQDFAGLGLAAIQADALREALAGPAGIIFLTGPTGSGKTTTLHAALHALDHGSRVIHTLEDPVEYEFPGIRQTEIREKIGLTFASSLRALLRQNPDVLLVGETRDAETAQLAVRAALTGHLVLSTLHTNDALAAIPRLRDLGVESFLLAASLRLVAAQRLVRRLPVGDSVVEAILSLVRSARPGPEGGEAGKLIAWGPGPRASQSLMLAVRARALLDGRLAPSVDDVLDLAEPVLKHRMALTFSARAEGRTIADVVTQLKARIG